MRNLIISVNDIWLSDVYYLVIKYNIYKTRGSRLDIRVYEFKIQYKKIFSIFLIFLIFFLIFYFFYFLRFSRFPVFFPHISPYIPIYV